MMISAFSIGGSASSTRPLLDEIKRVAERMPDVSITCRETDSGFILAFGSKGSTAPVSSACASTSGDYFGAFHGRVYDWGSFEKIRIRNTSGNSKLLPAANLVHLCRLGTPPQTIPVEINGDYCFHVWDEAQGQLVAAVDPLATHALFYAFPTSDCIVISSSTRAIRRFAGLGVEVDDDQVVAYVSRVNTDPNKTLCKGIYSLPGGHILEWRKGHKSVRRYWSPWLKQGAASQAELLSEFHDLAFEAMRCRIRGRDRMALLMSGGFDSTSLAGIASRLAGMGELETDRLAILSSVFPGESCDETARIDQVTAQLPFACRKFSPIDRALHFEDIEAPSLIHDMPHLNLQDPIFRMYADDLKTNGIRRVITGIGGDEISTDYAYWGDLLLQNGALRLPRSISTLAKLETKGYLPAARMLVSWWIRQCLQPALPPAISRILGKRFERTPPPWLDGKWSGVIRDLSATPAAEDVDFDSHTLNMRWNILVESRSERARQWWFRHWRSQSADSLAPFFDRRLYELVFSTPIRYQPRSFDEGQYKPIITKTLGRYIPDEITAKYWKIFFGGFETNVFEINRALIEEYLFGQTTWRCERFISRDKAKQLFASFSTPIYDHSPALTAHHLTDIVGLESWLRVYENEPGPQSFVG